MKNLSSNEMENVSGGLSSAAQCAIAIGAIVGSLAIGAFSFGLGAFVTVIAAGSTNPGSCDNLEGNAGY